MSSAPASELLAFTGAGRAFTTVRRVRLGDVDPNGELRLDAIARYLQDVASDDALDADLPNAMGWVVRRTMIRVDTPPTLNDSVELVTWCTGAGRSWAERRTSLRGVAGGVVASIDAVSLWIQIDIATGRPARLGPEFDAIYGPSAGDRVVSSKLALPPRPPKPAAGDPWVFRHTDLDPFGHVNNAAHWSVLEALLARWGEPRRGIGELEYLAPADLDGDVRIITADRTAWVTVGVRPATILRWTAS